MVSLSNITNSSGQSYNSGSKSSSSRRGGAGGNSTKMKTKPKKNKKKSTPKPAPVAPPKKVDTLTRQEKKLDPAPKVHSTPKPKPTVPPKRVDTLTRQEKKLDPTPKVKSTPKPKPSVPKKKVDTLTRQEKKLDPTPKSKLTISKDKIGYGEGKVDPKLAQAVNKPKPKAVVPEKKKSTPKPAPAAPPKKVEKAKVKSTPRLSTAVKDGPKFVRKYTGTKSTTKETHRYKRGTSFWDRMYSPKPKKATPKGGKPHVQTRTEPVDTPKVAEQNETATVYAVRDENVKVRTQKGSPSAEAFAYAQNVDKGMTSSAPKKSVKKSTTETLTRQEKKLDPAPKLKSTPKPKPAVPPKKVDTLTRQEKKLDPAPKLKSTPTPKPAVPKKRVDTLTRQEKKLDPTPKPKLTVPKKKVDTLTRQEKKLDPTPKPKVVTKKKANPKGGKPMIEQKLITKGNNVAHDAKKAAEERAAPAKEIDKSLELNKKLFPSKYRNGDTPSYNQAYWAKQRAAGVSQADMAAAQKKLGIKKAYSGDKVVTKANADTAALKIKKVTGSDATLQNGGVTKTTEKGGLLGEKTTTKYDYKDGPKITTKATDPVFKGVRFGEKKSTTYVDGIETATKTGHGPLGKDAKVTKPKVAGHITDAPTAPAPTKAASSPAQAAAGGSGAPALASVQPNSLTNVLAIKKNKRAKGKRNLINKRKGAGLSFGAGGTGLNIPT